jgi:hypothetical protein
LQQTMLSCNQQSHGKWILIKHRMKFPFFFIISTIIAFNILFTGCATATETVNISGQILVNDAGKVQKTGLAPIWIYDATNVQLTANIPLPDFGGRSRKDLARIRASYPGVLIVCSNYQAALDQSASAEMKYRDLNQKYSDKKDALHGQTNGPDFDAVKQLGDETRQAMEARDRVLDEGDDARELLFYWFNVNPGILYAGLPQPLATTQTDTNGNFSITLPRSKNIVLVTHTEGSINGQPGHYFWLQPATNCQSETKFILNSTNACLTKRNSELKPMMIYVLLDSGNGGISLGPIHRTRDSQQNWRQYWQQYYSQP